MALRATAAALVLAVAIAIAARAEDAPSYDLALRGGTLYLGGSALGPIGDVAIAGDRIVAVGSAPGRARREIDARGQVVAPGFIDLHNHSDMVFEVLGRLPPLPGLRANEPFVTQGVTTIVTGNCGTGPDTPDEVSAWLTHVDELPCGTNVAHLVPHGALRTTVLGEGQAERADPYPTPDEQARMEALLDGALAAGSVGLASGLEYDPGARADTEELVSLARVVAKHGGVYASHTRHEGPIEAEMLASYAEAIAIGERAGVPVLISHVKASGRAVHGAAPRVVELVEAARARGVRVYADQYPYIASSTGLSQVVPVAMRDGASVIPRHCEGDRAELRRAVAESMRTEMPAESIQISTYPWKWWLQGRTVAEVAQERGVDAVEVAMDLACGWPGFAVYHVLDEADVRTFMTRDWVATASDGLAVGWPFAGYVHPRSFGTFPRKLGHYARDEAVLPLAAALRSMTEVPAAVLGLEDRGRLAAGAHADVVAFDPEAVRDRATYDAPDLASEGIVTVVVNGVVALDAGRLTGDRGGRALRR
jgi:N-acyl-D-aspartate/D-glutamate deacylase